MVIRVMWMIRTVALAAMLSLTVLAAQAQNVTVTYPDGTVAFAYPAGPGGNLYIMHPNGSTSNVYPLAGDAFSIVSPDGSIALAFPHGPDGLIVTRTGLRPDDLKRLGY
jgi:hypothetical protein